MKLERGSSRAPHVAATRDCIADVMPSTTTDLHLRGLPTTLPGIDRERTDTRDQWGEGSPPRRLRIRNTTATGLAFDLCGGPLVAVCGLHGGAGTSTLAHALAATAAAESREPVLLAEAEPASGDIARLTGTSSPQTLGELALAHFAGTPPDGGSLARAADLRVLAGARPAPIAVSPEGAVAALLEAARARHGLTVVDAGALRDTGAREILRAATHIIWTVSARPAAADMAHAILVSELVPPLAATQVLAVRAGKRDAAARRAAGVLRRVAGPHCQRVVHVPHAPGDRIDITSRQIRGALTALAGPLTSLAVRDAR